MRTLSLTLAGLFLLLSLSAFAADAKKATKSKKTTKVEKTEEKNPTKEETVDKVEKKAETSETTDGKLESLEKNEKTEVEKTEKVVSKDDAKDLLRSSSSEDRILVGPAIKIGIPHPINLTGEVKFNSDFSAAIGAGYLSVSAPTNGTTVSVSEFNLDIRGRWHPFGGALFLGVALGTQKFAGTTNQTFNITTPVAAAVPLKIEAAVKSIYVAPHVGWMWWFNPGFFMGLELGAQIPVSPSSELTVTATDASQAALVDTAKATADYIKAESDARELANKAANQTIPYITLLRVGYLF